MNVRPGRPAKPEQTDWNGESTDKRRRQSPFWLKLAVVVELWLDVFVLIPTKWGKDDKSSDQDTEKSQTFCAKCEAVYLDKDERERFEPDVKKTVN